MKRYYDKATRELLDFFDQHHGKRFRIKYSTLTDTIRGIDWRFGMIRGNQYGDFAANLIELVEEETPLPGQAATRP